jgi:hypothetical protein
MFWCISSLGTRLWRDGASEMHSLLSVVGEYACFDVTDAAAIVSAAHCDASSTL